jgi:hypothetical protein
VEKLDNLEPRGMSHRLADLALQLEDLPCRLFVSGHFLVTMFTCIYVANIRNNYTNKKMFVNIKILTAGIFGSRATKKARRQ